MPIEWNELPRDLLDRGKAKKADPYLRIAAGTGFVDHPKVASGDPSATLPISVELVPAARRPRVVGMKVPNGYPATARFFTASVTPGALNNLLAHPDIARVRYAGALLPQRAAAGWVPPWPVSAVTGELPAQPDATELLLGVIDDGCPFAHRDLRRDDGRSTRVVALWNQDGDGVNAAPPKWGYGSEWSGAQLNGLIQRATDARGGIDEHLCYLYAGAGHALRRVSHGAHALGILAGSRRYVNNPQAAGTVPVHELAGPTGKADIAFVQLPRQVLNAPFPPAAERHALDALRYLLELGRKRGARRIYVSFAYESWLGAHDGSGWFESAVADLLKRANTFGIRFDLFLVAGNSGRYHVHQQLPDEKKALVSWRLPPDNQIASDVEIWVPRSVSNLRVRVIVPGLGALRELSWGRAVAWPSARAASLCVVTDNTSTTRGDDADVVVVRMAPTRVFDGRQPAPHGEWSVELTADDSLRDVHVYVGRGTESFGAPPRGRQTELSPCRADQQAEDRFGTLNGCAHRKHEHLFVATASVAEECVYLGAPSGVLRNQAPPYDGFGPSRNGIRRGPDFSVAFEHGIYHPGCIGIGNRSATTFRLIGTSVAAPLGARLVLDRVPAIKPIPPDERQLGLKTLKP